MDDVRLIDANALYEDVSRMGLTNGSTLGRHSGMADAIAQMIQDAPTIDPESLRPVSEWELNPDKWTCEWFRCKKCHHTSCSTDAFCGGCGAKMKNTDAKRVIAASREIEFARRQPEWIRTAERKPTAEDANEDGCVLSININPGDMNTTNWPWNMVAAFPDNLPVWMPLPKKPYLGKEK